MLMMQMLRQINAFKRKLGIKKLWTFQPFNNEEVTIGYQKYVICFSNFLRGRI